MATGRIIFIIRSTLRYCRRCSMCQYVVPAIRAGASVLFATYGMHATIWYATTIDTLDHSHVLQTHSPAGAACRRHSTLGSLTKSAGPFTQCASFSASLRETRLWFPDRQKAPQKTAGPSSGRRRRKGILRRTPRVAGKFRRSEHS